MAMVELASTSFFFAGKDAATGKLVVFVDQRRRRHGKFQPSRAKEYLRDLSVCPDFLEASGARLVRGIMNCVSASNLATLMVPQDCFLLSRDETEQFHGTLAYHPACSPVVSINSACKTALKTVLRGNGKEVNHVIEEIFRKRAEPSGGFRDSDELLSFFNTKRFKVKLEEQMPSFQLKNRKHPENIS
ncbi:TPA: hypothetical protein N0F65_002272 [Lagenidium giganteum]|uniref:Uncharacterized protein n=1 Tax=Lagenidium giganteum TaxID=4803 RepID=A0AAV2YPE9_9STRA|nr:TPA: hypothetical protein N0F65_002272 [Lagenidium giganteum]